ncbi:hypothetical protein LBMAG42_52320 [Deltaproteobacteria bacterium]|nr:hypothetical protein LBMAG42_52320 [Deltaproteobacteria bacterium]
MVFHKVKEEFGGVSNMNNDVALEGGSTPVRTSEALYQAMKLPHPPDDQRVEPTLVARAIRC